jgi:hypothetical protein
LLSIFLTALASHTPSSKFDNFEMGKAAADTGATGQKMIPADCVSVLLMALGNTSITKAQYDMMSALDGSRTPINHR